MQLNRMSSNDIDSSRDEVLIGNTCNTSITAVFGVVEKRQESCQGLFFLQPLRSLEQRVTRYTCDVKS